MLITLISRLEDLYKKRKRSDDDDEEEEDNGYVVHGYLPDDNGGGSSSGNNNNNNDRGSTSNNSNNIIIPEDGVCRQGNNVEDDDDYVQVPSPSMKTIPISTEEDFEVYCSNPYYANADIDNNLRERLVSSSSNRVVPQPSPYIAAAIPFSGSSDNQQQQRPKQMKQQTNNFKTGQKQKEEDTMIQSVLNGIERLSRGGGSRERHRPQKRHYPNTTNNQIHNNNNENFQRFQQHQQQQRQQHQSRLQRDPSPQQQQYQFRNSYHRNNNNNDYDPPGIRYYNNNNHNHNNQTTADGGVIGYAKRSGSNNENNAAAAVATSTSSSLNYSGNNNNGNCYYEEWNRQKQQQRDMLGSSINKTFIDLTNENPDKMEENNIRRAIELSMLDVAIVYYNGKPGGGSRNSFRHGVDNNQQQRTSHQILGVPENADPAEIKTAYRKLARLHHPDKGGDARRFEEIARAYRSLLSSSVSSSSASNNNANNNNNTTAIAASSASASASSSTTTTTATWDKELQDHRKLVDDLFRADGMDLSVSVAKQLTALDKLGLDYKDAGTTNRNERDEIITNSCFYLSLATSYLLGIGALSSSSSSSLSENNSTNNGNNQNGFWSMLGMGGKQNEEDKLLIGDTALHLKRTIEAAVVKAHPEWAVQGKVGEEVQAFSDFLVYTLDSQTLLSDWAVIVFDSTSGFCDVYKGKHYNESLCHNPATAAANTITLRYVPGHYQPLIPTPSTSSYTQRRPTLKEILSVLDAVGVFYVVTDGGGSGGSGN